MLSIVEADSEHMTGCKTELHGCHNANLYRNAHCMHTCCMVWKTSTACVYGVHNGWMCAADMCIGGLRG